MADRRYLGVSAIYTIVAPLRCAPFRPTPGLGSRPLLRWQLVRETRKPAPIGEMSVWGYEHVSYHWTWRRANQARLQRWGTPDASLDPTAGE